jgi:hypothetical protein
MKAVYYTASEMIDFLTNEALLHDLRLEDDLLSDHGLDGDDFHELIDAYQKRFAVDMSGYCWYFHAGEEGYSIGALFFDPPYKRVKPIAVTPAMLLEFANKGSWSIDYPEHQLPKQRWDIIINQVCIVFFLAMMMYACVK